MPKFQIASRLAALASVILISLSACGGGGNSSADKPPVQATHGTVSGHIADAQSGEPVAGVEVTIGAIKATSDAAGKYSLAGVPTGANIVAQFSKPEYASSFATLEVDDAKNSVADRRLAKLGVSKEVSAAAGGVVALAGSSAQVDLPAGGFVNAASGTAYTGSVTVSMTPIDPRASPEAMPGNYRAQGEAAPIESMGALQVEMRDSAGALLNLAPGKTATIRIPVPAGMASAPLAIPLYYFKEATGMWVREGMAQLRGAPPQQYYEGSVAHFTWWNADQPLDTIYLSGCVVNPAGQPLDATITANGIDYVGTSYANTLPIGQFKIAVRRDSEVLLGAHNGDDLATQVVRTGGADMTLSPCMVISQNAPTIATEPSSVTIASGHFTSLTVSANNATQYRWYRDGVLVASGSPNLWIVGAAGNYYVVVSNAHGSVTSATVTVKLAEPLAAPVMLAQPEDMSIVAGSSATFVVQAQGESLTYQWLLNGVPYESARGPRLSIPAVALGDDGRKFTCIVSNGAGAVTSAAATLHVTNAAVAVGITQQPASVSIAAGQRALFVVRASGTGPFSYQWLLNGNVIPGATAATYQTATATVADNGAVYGVRVNNMQGSVLSSAASLSVTLDTRVPGLYLSFPTGTRLNGEFAYAAIPEAGGSAVSFLPAGQGSLNAMLVQGQINNNVISDMHIHGMLYWKNNQLFRRDLAGANGLPAEKQISNLSGTGVCNKDTSGSAGAVSAGGDFSNASTWWKIVQKQGNDGQCDTDDDRYYAVRVDMAASEAPLEVPRPVASIMSPQGVLTGWLVRNGQLMQRTSASFTNPVTLFTLPADALSFEMDPGLDGTWIFTSGDKVYAVDLGSSAPAALTPIATLAEGETMFASTYAVDKNLFITISNGATTRVVRYTLTTKAITAVGNVPGASSIVAVTPTRVILHGALGKLLALPVGGGAAQVVYAPPTPRISFLTQRGGERLWQDLQEAVVSVNSDGSGVQVLSGAKMAGCLYKAQASVDSDFLMCEVVLVIEGNVVNGYDAVTGTRRISYGTINLPAAPLTSSMFTVGFLSAWNRPFVLSQYITNPNDPNQLAIANYYVKAGYGATPIGL